MISPTMRRGVHGALMVALLAASASGDEPAAADDAQAMTEDGRLRVLKAPGPALPQADDAEADAERFLVEPPAALPEELGEHFSVRVQRVQMQQIATFNEEGELTDVTRTLMLTLQGQWDGGAVSPVSFVGPDVQSAVTGVGEQIKPENRAGGGHHRHINRVRHGAAHGNAAAQNPSFHATVQLKYPQRPAWTIERLEALVEVTFAQGPVRYLVLGPLEDVFDKNVQIEGVDGSHIQVSKPADNHGRVLVNGDLAQRVVAEDIRLVGADGQEKDMRSAGVSQTQAMFHIFLRRNLPPDGYLVIPIYDQTVTRELPVELRNIPLPSDTPGVL